MKTDLKFIGALICVVSGFMTIVSLSWIGDNSYRNPVFWVIFFGFIFIFFVARVVLYNHKSNHENQFEEITEWQKKTFGQATTMSKLNHLAEELIELTQDVKNNNPNRRLEFADCFLLLYGAARADGMSYDDIYDCIEEKMVINKKRIWGKPGENGVVNHVKYVVVMYGETLSIEHSSMKWVLGADDGSIIIFDSYDDAQRSVDEFCYKKINPFMVARVMDYAHFIKNNSQIPVFKINKDYEK